MERFPHVRLFGGPALVERDGERPLTPGQRAFLALPYVEAPGTLTRERITWLLWEDGESRRTRHRIRQLIYSINALASAPVLERSGESVLPRLPSDTDGISAGDGDPLAVVTSPTTAYEQWLDGSKEHLRRLRRRVLAAEADHALSRRDWTDLALVTARLARTDPRPGPWIDALVDASIRSGRIASCAAVLSELVSDGLLGEKAFRKMTRRLRAVPPLLHSRGDTSEPEVPLVGRATEEAWIHQRASQGSGLQFVLIAGAAGIGKTRLLEAAGRSASAPALRVLAIRFTELTASSPLSGMRQVLHAVLTEQDLHRIPAPWNGILGLASPKGGEIEVLAPDSNNRRLTQAFRRAFHEGTRHAETLILVDDFHLIDATSLRLLQSLAMDWHGGTCTIMAAGRLEGGHSLSPRLAAFCRGVRAHFLLLEGLTPDDCVRLLEEADVQALPSTDLDELYQISQGNPLLLLDLARMWTSDEWTRDAIPQTLRAVIEHRMASLPGIDLQVLGHLAASGDAGSSKIEACLALKSWEVLGALNSLVARELIHRDGATYRFRHSLLRDAVRQELGPTRTSEAHLALARWLRKSGDGSPAEIVHHFKSANAIEEAAQWATSAAEEASAAGALVEALEFFELALESKQGAANPELAATAGRMALLLCHRDRGIRLLEQAEALGRPPDPSWTVDRYEALSELGRLSHDEAADAIIAVSHATADRGDWLTSLLATESAIRVLERAGRWKQIRTLIQGTAASSGEGGWPAEVRRGMIQALAMVYGDPVMAGKAARAAFDLARRECPRSELVARAAHRLFVVLLSEGTVNSPLGATSVSILEERARSTGDLRLEYTTLANRAVWHLDTGDLDTAEALLKDAETVVAGSEASNEMQNLATNRGDLYLRRGEPARALECFNQAQALIDEGTRGFLKDLVRAGTGLCHIQLGRFNAAEMAIADIGEHEHYYFDPSLLIRLKVEVLWYRRQARAALTYLESQRAMIARSFVPQYLNLTLWEVRLRRRAKLSGARGLAREVFEAAGVLELSRVEAQAKTLLRLCGT
ncbi:MAG: ATP-binding protein [Phycisphaerales bacterium JB040]